METKWLEDFVSLAETRSFSRSAQLRHVTQPAFSRRIQSLEAWAGIDLVDRSSYPTRLTPAGESFHAQALEILGALQAGRNMMRSHQVSGQDTIEFAVSHTLAFAFFPHWLMGIRREFGAVKMAPRPAEPAVPRGDLSRPAMPDLLRTKLIALNVHDAVLRLTDGGCDLLIAYHHASQPLQLSTERYEMISLGEETVAPYARADEQGEPIFRLPGSVNQRVPFLAFAAGAYLGHLVDEILKHANEPTYLDAIHETDMAEGLKAMAMEGHGLAFLPASSVRKELRAGKLVRAAAAPDYELTIEVRMYRERPGLARHTKPAADALWQFLAGRI